MPSGSFADSVKALNAQFWLLMAASEHLRRLAPGLAHANNKDHSAVVAGLLFGAHDHGKSVRLRNQTIDADMASLSSDCEKWLPSYFLVLAKSTAEGHLIEALERKVGADPVVASRIDVWRKARPRKPSRKKAAEAIMQSAVRGSFQELDSVVPLGASRPKLDGLATALGKYATTRNQLAHRLSAVVKAAPTVNASTLKDYLSTLSKGVSLIEAVM